MGKGQRKSGQWKDMKEEKKVRRRIGLRTGVQKKGKKEESTVRAKDGKRKEGG